jgi:hypothetical protein
MTVFRALPLAPMIKPACLTTQQRVAHKTYCSWSYIKGLFMRDQMALSVLGNTYVGKYENGLCFYAKGASY